MLLIMKESYVCILSETDRTQVKGNIPCTKEINDKRNNCKARFHAAPMC